jgi:hypothetical protein
MAQNRQTAIARILILHCYEGLMSGFIPVAPEKLQSGSLARAGNINRTWRVSLH